MPRSDDPPPKGARDESELAKPKCRQGIRNKKFLLLGVKSSCRAAQRTVTGVPQGALLWDGSRWAEPSEVLTLLLGAGPGRHHSSYTGSMGTFPAEALGKLTTGPWHC